MYRTLKIVITSLVTVVLLFSVLPQFISTTWAQQYPGALPPITCPRVGGTLVIIHWGDPKSFNPDSQVDDALHIVAMQLFNKLVALDRDYNVIPDLAESWTIHPNASLFVFKLRKGVKWHDGTPFSCKDVKYTFEAIKKYKGIAYGMLKMDKLVSVECWDAYTVAFRYSEPFAPFLGFLAWYGTYILPEHIYNKTEYKDWMDPAIPALTKPVGTGAFKFVEYVKGSHIILEANKEYFKGSPC
ncbi:MAG: ABC transporter substrate-binding protein, partial [Desulfurococcaceae archaeon]|nr:ABC transporter substrate-binding protein [Desulfurococcaceae archaeon]